MIVVLPSPWIQMSIGNLYWVTGLFFLPMAINCWVCRYYENKPKIPLWTNAIIALALLIRFACGFEFTSAVLISMEIPVMYYLLKHRKKAKKWFKAALLNGIAGIGAFLLAMGIWLAKLVTFYGTLQRALLQLLTPIATRVGLFGDVLNVLEPDVKVIIENSLQKPLVEILNYYLMADNVIFNITMMECILIYATILALTIIACKATNLKQALYHHGKLAAIVLLAFTAPVSWFVLGRGHASLHTHINFILWFTPLIPFMAFHIGYCVTTGTSIIIKHIKQKNTKDKSEKAKS